MFKKSCVMVVVMAVGGCGTAPLGTVVYGPGTNDFPAETALTPASFDGQWKQTGSPGKNNDACITVQGGAITVADRGCAGDFAVLTNSQVAVISGNNVTWVVETPFNGTTTVVTFNMTTQPDGSLQGSLVITSGDETGPGDSIRWVRVL